MTDETRSYVKASLIVVSVFFGVTVGVILFPGNTRSAWICGWAVAASIAVVVKELVTRFL